MFGENITGVCCRCKILRPARITGDGRYVMSRHSDEYGHECAGRDTTPQETFINGVSMELEDRDDDQDDG